MEIITVSKAIHIIDSRIKIAGFCLLATLVLIIYLIVQLDLPHFLILIIPFLILVIFLMLKDYLVTQWKLYAFERVNNLQELITNARNLSYIQGTPFATKWSICSKADKIKLTQIIYSRLKTGNINANLIDDKSVPHTFSLKSSRKFSLIYFGVCLLCIYQPVERIIKETSAHIETDYWLIGILSMISAYFLIRFLSPNQIFTISTTGIWSKKSGFQKWKAIKDIYVESSIRTNKERITELIIIFNDFSGIKIENQTETFDIRHLNKSSDEIEYAVKIFKQRVGNFAENQNEYSLSKKPEYFLKDKTKNTNNLVVYSLPAIILLIGFFLYHRANRTLDNYNVVTGKISYIENHFGKRKDKDNKFIQIENNTTVFKIFTGTESDAFSPKIDKTDLLKVNDTIQIYFDNTFFTEIEDNNTYNHSTASIVKNDKVYFHDGVKSQYFAYLIIGIGGTLLIIMLIVKLKK